MYQARVLDFGMWLAGQSYFPFFDEVHRLGFLCLCRLLCSDSAFIYWLPFFVNLFNVLLHSLCLFPFSLSPLSHLVAGNADNEDVTPVVFSECRRWAHKPRVTMQGDRGHCSCTQCAIGAQGRAFTWTIPDFGVQKWIRHSAPCKELTGRGTHLWARCWWEWLTEREKAEADWIWSWRMSRYLLGKEEGYFRWKGRLSVLGNSETFDETRVSCEEMKLVR